MDGTALVLCEGFFDESSGKTAHGLVRGTDRYEVVGVLDSKFAGRDAGAVLDGAPCGIPMFRDLDDALAQLGNKPDFLVMGIAPDGGMVPPGLLGVFEAALRAGINVDSGMHDYLCDYPELVAAAQEGGARIRDVRLVKKPRNLHFYEGRIREVEALRVAVLGTDAAVGKRTLTRILMKELNARGVKSEMIGTGQTAWMQGVRYGFVLDATINDFVAGELEHAILQAWDNEKPRVIFIEGQGCLTSPGFPGGFEILGAARPHAVILVHPPRRKEYDGFPGALLKGIETERRIIDLMCGAPVVAIGINHENMSPQEVDAAALALEKEHGLPASDVLRHGPDKFIKALQVRFPEAFV
jgi:uncharacterized NAD-dependent epimerase/dehydratase family protein